MSSDGSVFTSDNLDEYLKEVAKEYRKMGGKFVPAEIILIGGAAVIANYGFREMTTDIDAIIHASSAMKAAKWLVKYRFFKNVLLFFKIGTVFYILSNFWWSNEC